MGQQQMSVDKRGPRDTSTSAVVCVQAWIGLTEMICDQRCNTNGASRGRACRTVAVRDVAGGSLEQYDYARIHLRRDTIFSG